MVLDEKVLDKIVYFLPYLPELWPPPALRTTNKHLLDNNHYAFYDYQRFTA